jgi:Zn-dependent peptidase ImmA (M78 family)
MARPVQDAYEVHTKFYADSGGDLELPVDPFRIASAMGVDVYAAEIPGRASGFTEYGSQGPVIYINAADSKLRQRFTCAHELGHIVADRKNALPMSELKGKRRHRDEVSTYGSDPAEIYANRFAAALLMPKETVEGLSATGMTVEELARRLRVSVQAMQYRLVNLGLLA